MKVVFLTMNAFSKFVTYKRAVGTGEWLSRMGHDAYIVAEDCDENRYRANKEAPSCHFCWYKSHFRFQEILTKIIYIWQIRPDYIYSSVFSIRNLSCLGMLLPRRTKVILEFCELYSSMDEHHVRWTFLEWVAIKSNDMFLCASKYLETYFKKYMEKRGIKKRIIYSPYAFPDYLKPSYKENAQLHMVFMASLWRGYGVFEVLEAFLKVIESGYSVVLDIVGKGPAYNDILKWIDDHNITKNVVLHGYVAEENLVNVLDGASVFIAPMHDTIQDWARCPSKLYYYIPFNKPIVTCKIGDPYDTLAEHGYYYKEGSVVDMANAMCRALEDSGTFRYPDGFIDCHSWKFRAAQFATWISSKG